MREPHRNALRGLVLYWLTSHLVFKLFGVAGAIRSGAELPHILWGFITGWGPDLVFGAAFGAAAYALATRFSEHRRLPTAIWSATFPIAIYTLLNGYLAFTLGRPLSARLLVYTKSMEESWSVLEGWPLFMVLVCLVAVLAGVPVLSRRLPQKSTPTLRRLGAGLGSALFLLWVFGGPHAARWGLDRVPIWHIASTTFHEALSVSGTAATVDVDDWKDENPPPDGSFVAGVDKPSGTPVPRHVVLWIAEGVGTDSLSLYGAAPDVAPNLSRLASNGLVADRFYANTPISIKSLFALLCGMYPYPHKEFITHVNPRIACPSLMETLGAKGFSSSLFHGGIFGFTDKLNFLGGRGLDTMLDAHSIPNRSDYFSNAWGIDDAALVEHGLVWLDSQLGKHTPTLAIYVPIIPHYPYFLPPDAPRPLPHQRATRQAYLNGVRYSDGLFGQLHAAYEQRGIADDTLFIFVGDHGQAFYQHPGNKLHGLFLYEENVHVPLVLINSKLFPEQIRTGRMGSHVDFAPTLFELLTYPPPSAWQGQSLVGEDFEYRSPIFFTFYDQGRMGIRSGHTKLIWNVDNDTVEVFELDRDPKERSALTSAQTLDTAPWIAKLRSFQKTQTQLLKEYPTLDASYMESLFRRAVIEIDVGGATSLCEKPLRGKRGRGCAGMPPEVYASFQTLRVFNISRQCIRVHPPTGGVMRLTFPAPRMPPRLIGLGLWDPDKKLGTTPVRAQWQIASHKVSQQAGNRDPFVSELIPRTPGPITVEISSESAKHRTTCLMLAP